MSSRTRKFAATTAPTAGRVEQASNVKWLFVAVIVVIALWLIGGIVAYGFESRRGEIGDMFGAVNALFSGLAFAALIYTVIQQTEELGLQRQELFETRKELSAQKEEMVLQNAHFSQQNFEATFFQLLRVFNELVAAMQFTTANGDLRLGRIALKEANHSLHSCFSRASRADAVVRLAQTTGTKQDEDSIDVIDAAVAELRSRTNSDFDRYYRTLYNLLKFIHQSDIADKQLYANFVRATLSQDELLLLFYNCASRFGSQKFRPLLEEYAMLKHLDPATLLRPAHSEFYSLRAFGQREAA